MVSRMRTGYLRGLNKYLYNVSADVPLRSSSGISCRTWEPSRTQEPSFRTREPPFRIRELSCRSREPSQNFEPNPLFSPRGYPVLIPLTIAGVEALTCVNYYSMLLLPLIRD